MALYVSAVSLLGSSYVLYISVTCEACEVTTYSECICSAVGARKGLFKPRSVQSVNSLGSSWKSSGRLFNEDPNSGKVCLSTSEGPEGEL